MRVRAVWLPVALVLGALAVAGAALVAGAADPPPAPSLPELPSVAEQVDGLYDDAGCLQTGPDEVDCSVRAGQVDEALSQGDPGGTRHLAGFVGSGWLEATDGAGPAVVPATVRRSESGPFVAEGLVRNEGTEVLATVSVTARLLDAEGDEQGRATATSAVGHVRPGEPVPFTVTADVPAETVATVEWSAAAGEAGDGSRRELSWVPYWERPAGGDPVDLYLYQDGPGARPYLWFGAVTNVGGAAVADPEVVVAWLTPDGRVARRTSAPVRAPDGSPAAVLEPGAAGDALVRSDVAPPDGAEPLVWVQGS